MTYYCENGCDMAAPYTIAGKEVCHDCAEEHASKTTLYYIEEGVIRSADGARDFMIETMNRLEDN